MKAAKVFACSAAVVVALLVTTFNSPAPIFMHYEGVEGVVTVPGVTNGVEVLSFSVGHSRTNLSGPPTLSDLVVVKQLDKSSPKLAEMCASGQHIPKAVLHVRKAGGSGQEDYYTVTFEDLLVTSYSVGGGGGSSGGDDVPTESLSLNYTKIEWKYQPQDIAGVPTGPPVIGRWPPSAPGTP
ncbi:MAG TPA: type VI secretion system tube protein Hcp [Verrucomicrobiota bacterium]|nr:type VI secretion system tube protein Hcp [Verrucomicrobiota bacterium]